MFKSQPTLHFILLKTMERLVDRYLRDEALALVPLHPNQQGYQAGKSVETALQQLMLQVEKVLDQQETALGVFLDTKRGQIIAPPMAPCVMLLSGMGLITLLYSGLEPPWKAAWLQQHSVVLP
jgi:hypothetical protein